MTTRFRKLSIIPEEHQASLGVCELERTLEVAPAGAGEFRTALAPPPAASACPSASTPLSPLLFR